MRRTDFLVCIYGNLILGNLTENPFAVIGFHLLAILALVGFVLKKED